MEICEDFSDWQGCERIEEEISALEAILEEKNLTNPPKNLTLSPQPIK